MKFFRGDFLKGIVTGIFGTSTLGGIMTALAKNLNQEKKIKFAYTIPEKHWVGNGFNVHPLLRPSEELNAFISPFILMDYASPMKFSKTNTPRGIGEHPHRGFETVTFAYQGEVEHRDSSGGGGVIKPGDVQWMTAGSGVVHNEFHSEKFTAEGGMFEMVQLWVNLPKKHKMTSPKYQSLAQAKIPAGKIGESSSIRVVAGKYDELNGPANTFSKINIYDLKGTKEDNINLNLEAGTNTILLVMDGDIKIENTLYPKESIIIFEQEGEDLNFQTGNNFKGLLLNGEPINEPMVARGPFVMNTREEISDAIRDFQNGKMGKI